MPSVCQVLQLSAKRGKSVSHSLSSGHEHQEKHAPPTPVYADRAATTDAHLKSGWERIMLGYGNLKAAQQCPADELLLRNNPISKGDQIE